MSKLENILGKKEVASLKNLQKAVFENQITVTCVGLYNHGKSTLLNVLIKDFTLGTYKTADARETTFNKSVIYNGIKYVDTPGLNAQMEDDKKVLEAIQNSDIILFVHTITTGEFNKKEIEFLENINQYWKNPQEFIERTIFVLSRIDNIENSEDIEKTSIRMKEQIKDIFDMDCQVIPISSTDYVDGMIIILVMHYYYYYYHYYYHHHHDNDYVDGMKITLVMDYYYYGMAGTGQEQNERVN